MNKTRKDWYSARDEGFTLIELLVIVIIIGILGSIMAPGWLAFLNRQRINAVREEVRSTLEEAKTKSQQRSAAYNVTFGSSADGPTATLAAAGTVGSPIVLGSDTKNIQVSTFKGSTATTIPLAFDYRGRVSSDNLPFVIKITANDASNNQKCLIVSSLLGGLVEAKELTCDSPNLGV